MFERFTELAVNVVSKSQEVASDYGFSVILPEHLMVALVSEAKGVSLRLLNNNNITAERVLGLLYTDVEKQKSEIKTLHFSPEYKKILNGAQELADASDNKIILYEHLFLSLLDDSTFKKREILFKLGLDLEQTKSILYRLVQKKTHRLLHPEADENENIENKSEQTDLIFNSAEASKVFQRAVAKLSASNYEIMGTEQILSSILEDKSTDLCKILNNFGITDEEFEHKLKNIQSRTSEYEGRQIIFTPNAFKSMSLALQTAKELGSSEVLPEHMILGILKAKKGLAYNIIKEFNISDDDLAHAIIKPIEKEMPEALTIFRLAKEETRRIGRNVVGTEMLLLGIIGEGTGIGAKVLKNLEINIKDARSIVENIVGFGNDYNAKEITFTERAKRVLERGWQIAKEKNKSKIESSDLLLAILSEPTSLAMMTLEQLGTDSLEIKEGIKKFANEN